jgi:hypothetical protein
MEVTGKIKVIGETLQVTDSYKKRELVITTEEQYPQHISIEFPQDKTSLLDNRLVGENVKVSINIGGREWVNPQGETKYFNSIKGWKIEKLGTEQTQQAKTPPQPNNNEEENDDLAF